MVQLPHYKTETIYIHWLLRLQVLLGLFQNLRARVYSRSPIVVKRACVVFKFPILKAIYFNLYEIKSILACHCYKNIVRR